MSISSGFSGRRALGVPGGWVGIINRECKQVISRRDLDGFIGVLGCVIRIVVAARPGMFLEIHQRAPLPSGLMDHEAEELDGEEAGDEKLFQWAETMRASVWAGHECRATRTAHGHWILDTADMALRKDDSGIYESSTS